MLWQAPRRKANIANGKRTRGVKSFPVIVNVVVLTKAKGPFDIEQLSTALPRMVYEPETFPGLIYRRQQPKATIIMFSTGKIASTGSKSERVARESLRATASDISCLTGQNVVLNRIKTENVVAMFDIGDIIDVEEFAARYPDTIYEPRRFPGAICRLVRSVTVLVFRTGKMVSVGSKSENEGRSSIRSVCRALHRLHCIGHTRTSELVETEHSSRPIRS